MKTLILLVLGLLVLSSVSGAIYYIDEREKAIKLRFGALLEANIDSGIHWKLPFIDNIKRIDARVLTSDAPAETYYTLEKKPLIVDSFVKWRVEDTEKFYRGTNFEIIAALRLLQERVNEGLRNQISRRDMAEVISGERDLLMEELRAELDTVMLSTIGVTVIDVRVKRIDLPQEVSSTVYDRMNSEREIEARQYRAEGEEEAYEVRAKADREAVVIEANAYKESEQLRGDGDASSAAIYASAFNQDPEFYKFYRSINAYTKVFKDKSDLLVLDPNSEFFQYLETGKTR
jgi:membrane protease subunit HflC